MSENQRIPLEFWDEDRNRFNSHAYFSTVQHHHIADYNSEITCDVMIVQCADGRWYIEDNWGGDAQGAHDVFNPFVKESYPTFFQDVKSCNQRAAEIVSSITGCNVNELMLED